MKNLYLFIGIILIASSTVVFGSDIGIHVNFIVHKNDSVNSNVYVGFIRRMDSINSSGNYSLAIFDAGNTTVWRKNYDLKFIILTDPPKATDYDLISDTIPYTPDMYEIRLYHNNKLIFQQYLDFCDNNNICDLNENALSCPNDCSTFTDDGVCLGLEDGYCDPDCSTQYDVDCIKLNRKRNILKYLIIFFTVSISFLVSAIYVERFKLMPIFVQTKKALKILFDKIKQSKFYRVYKKLIYVITGKNN